MDWIQSNQIELEKKIPAGKNCHMKASATH